MANLGYFQLKAAPGLWKLSLAPGASRDIYALRGSTGIVSRGTDGGDDGGVTDDLSSQVGFSGGAIVCDYADGYGYAWFQGIYALRGSTGIVSLGGDGSGNSGVADNDLTHAGMLVGRYNGLYITYRSCWASLASMFVPKGTTF